MQDTRVPFRDSVEYKERFLQNKDNDVRQSLYKGDYNQAKDQPVMGTFPVSIMKPSKHQFDSEGGLKHRRPIYAREPSKSIYSENSPPRPMTSVGYNHRTGGFDDEDYGHHRYNVDMFPDRASSYHPAYSSYSQLSRPKTAPRNPYKGLDDDPGITNDNRPATTRQFRYDFELYEDQENQECLPRYTDNSDRLLPDLAKGHTGFPPNSQIGYQSYQTRNDYHQFPEQMQFRDDLPLRSAEEMYPTSLIDIVEGLENDPATDYISLNKLQPASKNFDTDHVSWNYEDPDCDERTVMDEIFFSTISDS